MAGDVVRRGDHDWLALVERLNSRCSPVESRRFDGWKTVEKLG